MSAVASARTAAVAPSAVVSVLRRRSGWRRAAVAVAALLVLVALAWLTLTLGVGGSGLGELGAALRGDAGAQFIVGQLRAPRLMTGALVGVALGCSGSLIQSVARNPLASPDVISVTAGASLGGVIAVTALHASGLGLAVATIAGAALALAVVFAASGGLPGGARHPSTSRFVLTGIAVSAMCMAFVSVQLTRTGITQAAQAYAWLTGSLNGSTWAGAGLLAATCLPLALLATLIARPLGLIELGADAATGLGVRVGTVRLTAIALGAVLAALAVAGAGPLAFVALMAGPSARRLAGTGAPVPLLAGLTGAVLVVASDLIAQFALPSPLPVGVITGVVGAPYLIWLLVRSGSKGMTS